MKTTGTLEHEKIHGGDKQLTDKLHMILLEGPKVYGSLKPEDALGMYEESMTGDEYNITAAFLNWCVKHHKRYGHGTLDDRWAEWLKADV